MHRGVPPDLNPNDTILLEGGADIATSIYKERPNKFTGGFNKPRDLFEVRLTERGIKAGCSFIGICRGAQLLTAMLGGSLIQHVTGHSNGEHQMTTADGETMWATSVHHQMMYPFDLPSHDYEILAHSTEPQSRCYLREQDLDMIDRLPKDFVEPEVVWFPKIRGLAIQGHPEYTVPADRFYQYCVNLAKEKIAA